jgi:hypothetical protein
MNTSQAKMDLVILNAKAEKIDEVDFITDLVNMGLAQEIITRLQVLFKQVKYLAGQTINIGKIILMQLWEFLKENQNMVAGFAVGIGLTALSSMLVATVPLIGGFLSAFITPIVAMIAIPIGTLKGHRLDKRAKNEVVGDSLLEDLITIAKNFWSLFVNILESTYLELKDEHVKA